MANELISIRPPEVERRLAVDNLFKEKVRRVIDRWDRELYEGELPEVLKAGKLELYDVSGLRPDLAREEIITIEREKQEGQGARPIEGGDQGILITHRVYKGGKLDPDRCVRVRIKDEHYWDPVSTSERVLQDYVRVLDEGEDLDYPLPLPHPHEAVIKELTAVLDREELTPTVSLIRTIDEVDPRLKTIKWEEWSGLPQDEREGVMARKHKAMAELVRRQPILATILSEQLRDYFLAHHGRDILEIDPIFRLLDSELPLGIFLKVFAEEFEQRRFTPKFVLEKHSSIEAELKNVRSFLDASVGDFAVAAVMAVPALLILAIEPNGGGNEPEIIQWAKHLPSGIGAWSLFLGLVDSVYFLRETHNQRYQELCNALAVLKKYLQEEGLFEKPERNA